MPTLEAPALPAVPTHSPAVARIVLIGFMGAGKSTVGSLLAESLGWQFVDTDHRVEQKHNTTVAALFAAHGEPTFRQHESLELARALGQQHVVIAVGGGAPEVLTNRLLLEQTPGTAVVFLDAPLPTLFQRCKAQEGASVRPVLQDAVLAEQRFRTRAPLYRRCAHHSITTESLSPAKTAQQIVELLTLQL